MRAAYLAGSLAFALVACTNQTAEKPSDESTYSPANAFKNTLMVAAIKSQLAGDDLDSAQHVHVSADDGAVALSGSVRSAEQRTKDIALVRAMHGVKSVDAEQLGIDTSQGRDAKRTSDVALAVQVTGAIAAQTGVNALGVHVRAEAGTITLEGNAPTAAVKSTIIAATHSVSGVRLVVDRITVKN